MENETDETTFLAKVVKGVGLTIGAFIAAQTIRRSIQKNKKIKLNDKIVLITGGGRGLGIILARKLAEKGAAVVICGRSEDTLRKASADLALRTDKYLAIPCNITDKEQVRRLVQQIKDELGDIDILINNAGVIKVGPVEMMRQSDFEEAMNTHFWGPYYLINEVLPCMKEKERGCIVNIASIGSKVSFPHLLPYNASKFALSGLSEGLAVELRKFNIKVLTVYPGLMRTGSPRNIDVKGQHFKEYAWFKISDSLPVISMDADDAADKILTALTEGKRTLTLSVPAKIAVAVHGVVPGITLSAFRMLNFLLPGTKNGQLSKKGYESESKISTSFLTKKTDEAAKKNLEI